MVVLTAGIKLDRFKKNPVMLYMHDMDKLIGKWENVELTGSDISMTPVFNMKNEFAKEKSEEVEDEFLNGASMGLLPLKFESGEAHGFTSDVMVLVESELKEVSLCAIPSNQDALCLYDNDGKAYTGEKLKEVQLSIQSSQQPKQNTMDFKTLLLTTLKLAANSTDAEIATAFQNMANENVNLTADNKKFKDNEAKQLTDNIEDTLKLAIDGKKITEAQKPVYEALLKVDFKNGKAALDAIKPADSPVNLAVHVASAQVAAPVAGEFNLADRKTWKLTDYLKNDYAALMEIKQNKKEEYIALCIKSGIAKENISFE